MQIHPIIFKLLYKYLFSDEEKELILKRRTNKSRKVAEMIAIGLPQFKCDIIDFTDDDFETMAFFRFDFTIFSNMYDEINPLENVVKSFSESYLKYGSEFSFDLFLEGLIDSERESLEYFKDKVLNDSDVGYKVAFYMPTVLAIKMGNINVKSWAGVNMEHKGFYSFLVINETFMYLAATRNIYSMKEAKRGYVHPHVSPLYIGIGGEKIFGESAMTVNINGNYYINANTIRQVCLGDSDLGNLISNYSITNEDTIEMECIMISEELSRIFNSESDNSINFPYIRMNEMFGNGNENTDLTKVLLQHNSNRISVSFLACEISKYIYMNNLLHFMKSSDGYKCTDSTLYIMDIITKSYLSVYRNFNALNNAIINETVSVYKYKTDGINVYMSSDSSSSDLSKIESIKEVNDVAMFTYHGDTVKYNLDIVEVNDKSDEKTMVNSSFCSDVLRAVYGLKQNTGHCASNYIVF